MADEPTASLPYGTQRRVEIVRAVATKPQLLFLDEPAAGMNPEETADLGRLITRIREHFGITVVLIEHDMSLVMKLAESIYVLDHGAMIASGTPNEIQTNAQVISAYLGGETMLEVKHLVVNYGGIQAVKDVSFSVQTGRDCRLDWRKWCW